MRRVPKSTAEAADRRQALRPGVGVMSRLLWWQALRWVTWPGEGTQALLGGSHSDRERKGRERRGTDTRNKQPERNAGRSDLLCPMLVIDLVG